jgi:hypothetical protein
MKKLYVVASVLALVPAAAMADNVGQCGWGSKVFDGQSGMVPQVLAVTTNGTFGNQTFGITSGTSGCTQDGKVSSSWKTSLFIDGNKEALARDMSVGGGETLESLAHLLGIEGQDRVAFGRIAKDNVARIFPSSNVTSQQVAMNLRDVLAGDAQLARYTAAF